MDHLTAPPATAVTVDTVPAAGPVTPLAASTVTTAGAPLTPVPAVTDVVVDAVAEAGAPSVARATLDAARDDVARGRIREGLELLGDLRAQASQLAPADHAVLLATLVECRLARGDLAEAMALGDELAPLLEADELVAAVAHHARGELAAALGDPGLAVTHFDTAGRLEQALPTPLDLAVAPWRTGAALARLRSGEPRQAAEQAREHLDLARADARPAVLAHALRVLAVVDSGPTRVAMLQEARALLPDGTADRLAAQIDTDLAGLVLLSPQVVGAAAPAGTGPVDALALLRAAEGPAGRQELWPLQGRIRRLLDLLGETPRRVNSEAAAALTASERKVARLAIDGCSNRQIAERLEVTVKAVEWHLGHVYRKLGIRSRALLAPTLGPDFQPAPGPGR